MIPTDFSPVWRRIRIGDGEGTAYVGSWRNHEPMFTPELEEAQLIDEATAKKLVVKLHATGYSDAMLVDTTGRLCPGSVESEPMRLTLAEYKRMGPNEVAKRCLASKRFYAAVMALVDQGLI
jgi:hypothetical protein